MKTGDKFTYSFKFIFGIITIRGKSEYINILNLGNYLQALLENLCTSIMSSLREGCSCKP